MSRISASHVIIGTIVCSIALVFLAVVVSNQSPTTTPTLPIHITEYFDYQCSHCARFSPILEELKNELGDDIEISYRHYPFINEASYELAYAATAAEQQGKFLEFHTALMTHFNDFLSGSAELPTTDLESVARDLSLDVEKFNADRADVSLQQQVLAQKTEGTSLGVTSTPTVFIDGVKTQTEATVNPQTGETDYSKFVEKIRQLVRAAKPQ